MVQFPDSLEERVEMLADVAVSDITSRYKMQGVLGAGAQATVYAGTARKSQRKVAIKVRAVPAPRKCPETQPLRCSPSDKVRRD